MKTHYEATTAILMPRKWRRTTPPRDGRLFIARNPAWPVDIVATCEPETGQFRFTGIALSKDGKHPAEATDFPKGDPENTVWGKLTVTDEGLAQRIALYVTDAPRA